MATLKRAVLCGVVGVLLGVASAQAAIEITPNPPGNVNNPNNGDVYKSAARFINTTTNFDVSGYSDTLMSKTFQAGVSTIAFNVSYLASDLDFGGDGLRWTEGIKNNSGFAWTSLVLKLSESSATFFADDVFSPAFVDVSFPGGVTTITHLDNFGTVTRDDLKTLTFKFNTPLQSGAPRFFIHAPIENLSGDDSFQLSQSVSAVPEASSLIVMGLSCIVAVGAVVVGRRYGVSFSV